MQFPESWLRTFCNPPLTSKQLADMLTMGGFEVEEFGPAAPDEDEIVFTLKLTPNLGHALSIYGIARELSALSGAPLNPRPVEAVQATSSAALPARIDDDDLCGRFSARVIRGVNAGAKTPEWMVRRLQCCGQRSVNVLADISNYVMLEHGGPTHIFDMDQLKGDLSVRWARKGEGLKLLDGSFAELDEWYGVVADVGGPQAVGGIMGGEISSVDESTRNIYVESAFWRPQALMGRARRLGIVSQAGHRFERGVDPAETVNNLERLTRLVLDICGGEPGPVRDDRLNDAALAPVSLRVERVRKVVGLPLSASCCVDALTRLGMTIRQPAPDIIEAIPPSWRFDIRIEEDLIEEVIRLTGYEQLTDTPPMAPLQPVPVAEARLGVHALRQRLVNLGYFETINFSFVEERWERELAGNAHPLALLNPIAAPLSVMRSSLIGSLVQVLRYNLAHKTGRARVFEIGRVYLQDATVQDTNATVAGLAQPMRIAGLAYGPNEPMQWGLPARQVDFFDVKGDVETLLAPRKASFSVGDHPAFHPGRCACVELDGRNVGYLGELHPQWVQSYELPQAPVLFELHLDAVQQVTLPQVQPIPRLQPVYRDIALVLSQQVPHERVMACIAAAGQKLLREALLFDVYAPSSPTPEIPQGMRSLTIRLVLLDEDAGLTDARSEEIVHLIMQRLKTELDISLRI